MGIFDFFKKRKKYVLPESYKGKVSEEEYNHIMDTAIQYHTEKGLKILNTGEGEILVELDGEEQHRYLDNLVRVLSSNERAAWKDLIYEHFDKLKNNEPAYHFFYKDFEYAEPLLRVLIKPQDFSIGGNISEYVHRIDFPETFTFLVIEFEDQFGFVRRENINEWEKSEEELFEIAIRNTPDEEIDIKECVYGDQFTVYTFFSSDYSAALMLDLQNRADFSIGTYGSLVAIPTKGSAFTHPIETGNIMKLVETLYPIVEQFFNEDPGCINTNFYWFYENSFEVFPLEQDENGTFITMPEELSSLIK